MPEEKAAYNAETTYQIQLTERQVTYLLMLTALDIICPALKEVVAGDEFLQTRHQARLALVMRGQAE